MLTHDNLLQNQRMIQTAFAQTEQSIILGWLPLYHDMGLIGNVLQSMYCGAPMHFDVAAQLPAKTRALAASDLSLPGNNQWRAKLRLRPVRAQDRMQERTDLDLRSWTVAFNGAEPVRHGTIDRFVTAFEPCGFRREAFFPCYGLAEATLFVSGGLKSAPTCRRHSQASSALETNEVVIAEGR